MSGQSEKVSTGQTDTTFSETIARVNSLLTLILYKLSTQQESAIATTNGEIYGNAIEVPFSDDFATKESSLIYTIIDANNDNSTWYWSDAKGGVFKCKYDPKNHGDDWLITPPIHMKPGKTYNVSFQAMAVGLALLIRTLRSKVGNKQHSRSNDG